MKVSLRFSGDARAHVELCAQSDAERAILGFLVERPGSWSVSPDFTYRPGATSEVHLVSGVPTPQEQPQ